jgi:histidyl-tRNA synthetase
MKYSALKGVHDIFPPDIYIWQKIEEVARAIFSASGFQELRAPIIDGRLRKKHRRDYRYCRKRDVYFH